VEQRVQHWTTGLRTFLLSRVECCGDGFEPALYGDLPDLLIVRPEDLAEDDPHWQEQLHRLAERIERWSGNHASLHEVSPKGLKAALRRGEPVIASLRDDSIVLAGPEIAALLARRRERAIA
jgi:hypothetical protein